MRTGDVLELLRSLSPDLHSLGVARVVVFGSTARGEARADSDVDLLLEFAEGRKCFDAFMDAVDLLESAFPVPVDVLTPESFSPARLRRISGDSVQYDIPA